MHPSIRKSRLRGGRVGPTCTSACLPYAGTKLQARMALRILLEYEYQCVYSIFLMKRQWGRGHLLKHREGRRWQHELAHPAHARQLLRAQRAPALRALGRLWRVVHQRHHNAQHQRARRQRHPHLLRRAVVSATPRRRDPQPIASRISRSEKSRGSNKSRVRTC
eukprot:COSAG01_NODE_12126_length_1797_cov_2.067727_2_plen_164_part_00